MSTENSERGARLHDEKIILPPQPGKPSDVERIKSESNYLRGTLVETLEYPISSGIPDDDNRL